jgi:parvulin-like peptidyl-prolyl isomerase
MNNKCVVVGVLCLQLSSFVKLATAAAASLDNAEAIRQARMAAKPWYGQNISDTIPLSPVSVGIFFLTAFYILYVLFGKPSYAVASHILLKEGSSDENKIKLEGWKKKICGDVALFEKYAAQYSDCPSKRNGGKLGRFGKGSMVPQFDRVCFDAKSPLKTTLGPIQTPFGWHLIYIEDRRLPECWLE